MRTYICLDSSWFWFCFHLNIFRVERVEIIVKSGKPVIGIKEHLSWYAEGIPVKFAYKHSKAPSDWTHSALIAPATGTWELREFIQYVSRYICIKFATSELVNNFRGQFEAQMGSGGKIVHAKQYVHVGKCNDFLFLITFSRLKGSLLIHPSSILIQRRIWK